MIYFLLCFLIFLFPCPIKAQTLPFHPIKRIKRWMEDEKEKSPIFFRRKGMLSTASLDGVPSCQTIPLIKLTQKKGIVFFLHKNQDAVFHLEKNPCAVLNISLQSTYREIKVIGTVQPLSFQEKVQIWKKLPKHKTITFLISDHVSFLESEKLLLKRKKNLEKNYQKTLIPPPETFLCFHLIPKKVFFSEKKLRRLPKREVAIYEKDFWDIHLLEP